MLLLNIASKSRNIFKFDLSFSSSLFSKYLLFIMSVIFLSGCAGIRDAIVEIPQKPLAKDQARIIVKRIPANKSKTDSLYSELSARVYVNGKKLGSMVPGDVIFTDVNKGFANIKVDNKALPGKYSLSINLKPNTEYKFDISARAESNAPGKLFGIFDKGTYDKSNKNTGLFKIIKVFSKKIEMIPIINPVNPIPKQKSFIKSNPISAPVKAIPKQSPIIRSKTGKSPIKAMPKQKTTSKVKRSSPKVESRISPSQKRLIELKKLLDEELITIKDYDLKKRQILKGL
jgi:hypothetical protein